MFDGGADDYARDPDVQKLVAEGGSSNDAEARKKAYSAAIQRITEQAYWLPLHTYVTTYGLRQAARLHALRGRAAALLPGEVEVAAKRAVRIPPPLAGEGGEGASVTPRQLIGIVHS